MLLESNRVNVGAARVVTLFIYLSEIKLDFCKECDIMTPTQQQKESKMVLTYETTRGNIRTVEVTKHQRERNGTHYYKDAKHTIYNTDSWSSVTAQGMWSKQPRNVGHFIDLA